MTFSMSLGLLRRFHRWIGLLIALPIAIQGATGAILTFYPMLPSRLVSHAGLPQPIAVQVAAARDLSDPASRVSQYIAPVDGGWAMVRLAMPSGAAERVAIDPVTLSIVDADGVEAIEWLRTLHVNFQAPAYGGRSIGGWFGIGLVILTITGIPLWWPRPGQLWRALTIAPWQLGLPFYARLHRAFGGWLMIVMAVLAASGVVLAFPRTSRSMLGLPAGGPPPAAARTATAEPPALTAADSAVALALQSAPGTRLRMVAFPADAKQPWRVFLLHPDAEGAMGSVIVQVDAGATKIMSVQDARTQTTAERVYRTVHDLHEGLGLGPAWRIVCILAGAALPVFAVSGPLIWWLRRRLRARPAATTARVSATHD